MSRYETYKESDFVGIGKVPEHWEVKRLKHLGEAIIGLTYSPNDITENEEGILVLRSSNIQDGFIAYDDCVYVDKEVNPNLITRKGDILICARNGSAHLVGKNICIDEKSEGHTFGAFMVVFRSKYWRYLSYFFNSPIFTSQTGMFSTTTINQLTSQTLNNLKIAYPSDSIEQENICNYLDDQTQKIDRLIANKKAQIEKLKELRKIEINNAVTKGLNPNVEMKDSGIEWIGDIPKDWIVISLKNVLLSMTNGTTITQDPFEDGIPVTRIETISDGTINVENTGIIPSDKGIENYYLKKGDILFSHINSFEYVANCAIFDLDMKLLHGMNLLRLIPNKNRIEPYFLIYLLKSDYFKKLTQSVCNRAINQVSISNSKLKNFKIVIPEERSEQLAIANYLDDQTQKIDRLIANKKAQVEKLQELRKIKIYEAVTGKIKVNGYE
jgi:type I restriction enzyme S subunit